MAIGAALLPLALGAQIMEKPNVILIMTDQQTAGAMSCAGNPYLRTPAMDALASDGIMFTGAYSPFPLSGPCRASLLTGCYPSVIGALENGAPYGQEYMDSGIGHRMSDAGYECLFAGKFHAPERNVPESSGFTKNCNFVSDPEIVPNVDRALDGYDGSKPLFMVVNFNNPHEICQAKHEEPLKMTGYIPEADPSRYPPLPQNFRRTDQDPDILNLEVECGVQFAHYPRVRFSELDWQRYLYQYYRLVERADNCIGDLTASLKSHGLYDDSIIVFCSDHGDGAAAHEWNGKWALMEESVNVPLIIKAPAGKGPSGTVNDEALYDLSSDKGEMHNLIADPEYASRLRDCRHRMLDWARRLGNWPCRTRIEPIVKYTYETSNDPVTILSTDLSVDLDPDDWVDAYLFLKSDWMRPQGIILADYAGREEFALARELEELAGRTDVPLLAGVNQNYAPGRKIRNTEGAEFILKTLREQRVKTRLIAVGSLRNEALAYEMDPDLFMRKVEKVVFVSVPTHGEKATNVNRDTSAVRVIFESGVPILAVPAVRQKLTGEMEKSISESQSPVARFMTARLADWRKRRNKDFPGFLERTGQLEGQGKNLWSLPAFIPETKWCCYGIKAVRCSASYSSETLTVFPPDSRGNDFIMTEWDEKALLEYAVRMISD